MYFCLPLVVYFSLPFPKESGGAFAVADWDIDEDGNWIISNWQTGGLDEKLSPETIRRNAEQAARYERKQEEIKAQGRRDLAEAKERSKITGIVTTASINVDLRQGDEDE